MFTPLSSYSPETQPLTRFRGIPVYLTTLLVAAHVTALLAASIAGPGAWMGWFSFYAPISAFGTELQLWRWVTYLFSPVPDIWFLLDMVMLYIWGMHLERTFGRKVFGRFYLTLLLLTPAVVWLGCAAGLPETRLLGTHISHFCAFLAFCFMEPRAPFFGGHPALQAKYVATVFFALDVVRYVGSRQTALLLAFLAACGFTYYFLRRLGMPERFGAFTSAFQEAMPKRPAAPRSRGTAAPAASASKPAAKYEAKIRPRPELAPEKKAVEEVDALLDKIARGGMASLTPAEREKLQRASERLQKPD